MSEIKKNKTTGSEYLLIGKQKFDVDKDGIFNMDLADVNKISINELPLDRKCLITKDRIVFEQMTTSNMDDWPEEINLLFVRRNTGLVEIIIAEEVYPEGWDIEITTKDFFALKESVLLANKSLNPKIIKHECDSHGQVSFEFSIELTASTIGEAFGKAVKTDTSLECYIMDAVKKGTSCIKSVLSGAFHIDVSNLFSGKDKNSTV